MLNLLFDVASDSFHATADESSQPLQAGFSILPTHIDDMLQLVGNHDFVRAQSRIVGGDLISQERVLHSLVDVHHRCDVATLDPLLRENFVELGYLGLGKCYRECAEPTIKVGIDIGHVPLVDDLNEDGFLGEGVVEAVHVKEVHALLIGLLQLAEAQRTLTELVLLPQDQPV